MTPNHETPSIASRLATLLDDLSASAVPSGRDGRGRNPEPKETRS